MPYKNIHFVKIKMELLEDVRFLFELNDTQKMLYLLMLALAGKTNNQIPDNMDFIKGRLNIKAPEREDLLKISKTFPKFRLDGKFWIFDNFDTSHNWVLSREWSTTGNSEGTPKELQRNEKNRIDKNRKRIEIDKNTTTFDFESLISQYPNKDGSKEAKKHFKASVKTEKDWNDIQTALKNYLASKRVQDGFVKNCSTWFNNWRDWIVAPVVAGPNSDIPESLRGYFK